MKRILIVLLLIAVMLTGMMPVHAAEAEILVQVCASKTEVQVGDTVEYTVLATGFGVVAMQFEVRFPEGLRYVPNSGATPENLAQKLGVPAADWTEISKMFTFYNDIGITFAKGTEILRFSCVVEKEGTWAPELFELLPFDGEFEEFTPQLQVQRISTTDSEDRVEPPVTEKPTAPAEEEVEPPVSIPQETQQPTEPENTVGPTQSATELDHFDTEGPEETVPEHIGQSPEGDFPDNDEEPEDMSESDKKPQIEEKKPIKILFWLLPLAVVAVIGGVALGFCIFKKKAL